MYTVKKHVHGVRLYSILISPPDYKSNPHTPHLISSAKVGIPVPLTRSVVLPTNQEDAAYNVS